MHDYTSYGQDFHVTPREGLRQESSHPVDPPEKECSCDPVRHWECNAGCKAAQKGNAA